MQKRHALFARLCHLHLLSFTPFDTMRMKEEIYGIRACSPIDFVRDSEDCNAR